jgi:Domain of unknown function (DUF1883)
MPRSTRRPLTAVASPSPSSVTVTLDGVQDGHLLWDLGSVEAGTFVDVSLWGAECDVLLLSTADRARFEEGRPFSFVGGHFQSARVRLIVPTSGQWHVAVVPAPLGSTVEATVRLTTAA